MERGLSNRESNPVPRLSKKRNLMNPNELLAELYWLEYMDAVEDAQSAYLRGETLQAIALAIIAHKCRWRYESAEWAAILGRTRQTAAECRA